MFSRRAVIGTLWIEVQFQVRYILAVLTVCVNGRQRKQHTWPQRGQKAFGAATPKANAKAPARLFHAVLSRAPAV